MRFPTLVKSIHAVLVLVVVASACERSVTSPEVDVAPAFAVQQSSDEESAAIDQVRSFVDGVNAQFAANGQSIRLDYPWLYRVGPGTDPYQSLRTGSRWTTWAPEYILDVADFGGTDVPAEEVETVMESAYATWNGIPRSNLVAIRGDDPADNVDVLDGSYQNGSCVLLYDLTSPNLDWQIDGTDIVINGIEPAADIVVGGFVSPSYFADCLGSEDIIGVTWTFFDVDGNGDQYMDRLYVEQFYNPAFNWTTSGSIYLDFSDDATTDLETIALHENGHAHGLGHFGGPLVRQPFTLKPNGRVFNPEAVMNPYYLGGEARALYPTDLAGFLTMYSRSK